MMSKAKEQVAVPASNQSPGPQHAPISLPNLHLKGSRPGPLAPLPLQASPVFGNILNQLFVVLQQQLMEPILLPVTLAHRPGCQLQQLGAGLEQPAGVAGGFGSFHLVPCQHPNLHASCVQGLDGLCQLLLQPASRSKASPASLARTSPTQTWLCRQQTPAQEEFIDFTHAGETTATRIRITSQQYPIFICRQKEKSLFYTLDS